jgi:hypothetical protein
LKMPALRAYHTSTLEMVGETATFRATGVELLAAAPLLEPELLHPVKVSPAPTMTPMASPNGLVNLVIERLLCLAAPCSITKIMYEKICDLQ